VGEVLRVDVVLGRHPAYVHQVRVLARVDPDSVKVLVDQLLKSIRAISFGRYLWGKIIKGFNIIL
jgi:hypothetical protein